jgi:hypothetical protein
LTKKLTKILFILCLITGLTSAVFAQETTGSIKGVITDTEGNILPGVTVTVTSPALMGTQTYISTETGAFRFPSLPPGYYKLVAEMAGFKTISQENIVIRVGMTVTLDLQMEMTTIEEEVTVTAASPTVDVSSTKIAVILDRNLLKNIPMARDLYDIVNSAPGAVSEGSTYRRTTSIVGATVRSNTYAFDGVNMNDPVVMYPLTNLNFDVMDEVEMELTGHPASVGYTDGAYINVVTRSGGNKLSGGAVVYFTKDSLAQHLWTNEQVQAMGVTKPGVDKSVFDGSLTVGGPIMVDRLWFFTNARYIKSAALTNFIPFTDFLGRSHATYDWTHEEKMGFIKLTSQLTSKIKLMGMFNYVDRYRPMIEDPGPYVTFESTRSWDHEKDYTGNGILSYIINQNTYIDLRVGYVRRWFPEIQRKETDTLPWVNDYAEPYGSITNGRFDETYVRKRFQTGLYFTRFQDNFLGGNHEFKGGVEFEDAYGDWDWWRPDNMLWYADSRYPHNYYYQTRGRVQFYICGPTEGSSKIIDKANRIGAYIQDSVTFAERLTVNLGIRFDRSWGWKPAATKKAGGNPLSVYLGETLVRPYVAKTYPQNFPNGLNPFADATAPEWNNIIQWNEFSPRFGASYDVFGNGKTALKFSFSQYTEYLMLQYFSTLHPFYPTSFLFYWYDTNNNNTPDTSDTYTLPPTDYRAMDPEFSKKKLDPNTKSPKNNEFTVGITQELFKNFSAGVNFIYKSKKNILDDARYAPDTKEFWYSIDQPASKKYWIPFTTTIPGTDQYPTRTVTFYVQSNNAPPTFYQFTNVSELMRKYWALEFLFNKRMADGWQFAGSVIYSKAYGNIGGMYDQSWGWTTAGDSPNNFLNAYGRSNIDRPLQIKLMGTAQLPYRVFLSTSYRFQSGAPWQRDTYISPPKTWCDANNAYLTDYYVYIETAGTRRYPSENYLDIRLEKEFNIGNIGRLGAYIDVTNLLGYSRVNVGMYDLLRWSPTAEGADKPGTKALSSGYKKVSSVEGVRVAKFSMRFTF